MCSFFFLSLPLSVQNHSATPKPVTPPPPTALNLTHGPAPAPAAPPTSQPAIVATTKVPVEAPAPALPPQTNHTNHSSALPPEPTTISGGEADKKTTPTLRPTTPPIPSTTLGSSNSTLTPEPDPDPVYDATLDPAYSDTSPSMVTKPPHMSTTPYVPSGMCVLTV